MASRKLFSSISYSISSPLSVAKATQPFLNLVAVITTTWQVNVIYQQKNYCGAEFKSSILW
jgi:hypothetical protein